MLSKDELQSRYARLQTLYEQALEFSREYDPQNNNEQNTQNADYGKGFDDASYSDECTNQTYFEKSIEKLNEMKKNCNDQSNVLQYVTWHSEQLVALQNKVSSNDTSSVRNEGSSIVKNYFEDMQVLPSGRLELCKDMISIHKRLLSYYEDLQKNQAPKIPTRPVRNTGLQRVGIPELPPLPNNIYVLSNRSLVTIIEGETTNFQCVSEAEKGYKGR